MTPDVKRLIDAVPKPGTYVMNLGEMLQVATNGYMKATPHRVQSPPSGRERISIANVTIGIRLPIRATFCAPILPTAAFQPITATTAPGIAR